MYGRGRGAVEGITRAHGTECSRAGGSSLILHVSPSLRSIQTKRLLHKIGAALFPLYCDAYINRAARLIMELPSTIGTCHDCFRITVVERTVQREDSSGSAKRMTRRWHNSQYSWKVTYHAIDSGGTFHPYTSMTWNNGHSSRSFDKLVHHLRGEVHLLCIGCPIGSSISPISSGDLLTVNKRCPPSFCCFRTKKLQFAAYDRTVDQSTIQTASKGVFVKSRVMPILRQCYFG